MRSFPSPCRKIAEENGSWKLRREVIPKGRVGMVKPSRSWTAEVRPAWSSAGAGPRGIPAPSSTHCTLPKEAAVMSPGELERSEEDEVEEHSYLATSSGLTIIEPEPRGGGRGRGRRRAARGADHRRLRQPRDEAPRRRGPTSTTSSARIAAPPHDPEVIKVDLSELDDEWITYFHGVDTVVHLAANPDESPPGRSWSGRTSTRWPTCSTPRRWPASSGSSSPARTT